MIEMQRSLFGILPVSIWSKVGPSFLDAEGLSDAVLRRVPIIVESIAESTAGQIVLTVDVLRGGKYDRRVLTYGRDEMTDLNNYLRGPIICRVVRVK